MGVVTGIVLYAVVWFVTLFIVLPIRMETQGDRGEVVPGTQAGAPADLNMKRKAWTVTWIAAIIWAILAVIILSGVITEEDFENLNRFGPPSSRAGGTGE